MAGDIRTILVLCFTQDLVVCFSQNFAFVPENLVLVEWPQHWYVHAVCFLSFFRHVP